MHESWTILTEKCSRFEADSKSIEIQWKCLQEIKSAKFSIT